MYTLSLCVCDFSVICNIETQLQSVTPGLLLPPPPITPNHPISTAGLSKPSFVSTAGPPILRSLKPPLVRRSVAPPLYRSKL